MARNQINLSDQVQGVLPSSALPGHVVQVQTATSTTYTNTLSVIAADDSIPQNTEGIEIITVSITPTSASNKIRLKCVIPSWAGNGIITMALFKDAEAGARSASASEGGSEAAGQSSGVLMYEMTAGATSSITFKVRVGTNGTTIGINGTDSTRRYGGVSFITFEAWEIQV